MTSTVDLIERQRRQNIVIGEAAKSRVAEVFWVLQDTDLDGTFETLAQVTADGVVKDRRTSIGVSAEFVREYRAAHHLPGHAPIVLADASFDIPKYVDGLHAVTVASVKKNVALGSSLESAMNKALVNVQGMVVKSVLDAGRDIVIGASARDKRSPAYQRVIGRGGCNFCRMLAGRGAVYSKKSSEFSSHNHCMCSVAPVYESGKTGKASAVKDFVPSTRDINESDRARVRQWLHEHPNT